MTEALVVVIVIAAVLFCLNPSGTLLVYGAALLMLAVNAAMLLFFAVCAAEILFSKRKKTKLAAVEKRENSAFSRAYYLVDEREVPNAFPSEKLLSPAVYKKEKEITVFYLEKKNKIYDKISVFTTVVGLVFSAALLAFVLKTFVSLF